MITIYVIVAVIGLFIYTFCKVNINKWLDDLSMSRLSLKRNREYDKNHIEMSDKEISDDESFGILPSLRRKAKHNEFISRTSHNTINASNSLIDTSTCEPTVYASSSKSMHNISDDLSSDDDDVIIKEIPTTTSSRQQSMFYWNKNLTNVPQYQNTSSKTSTLLGSNFTEEIPTESCNNEKQVTIDLVSSDDDGNDNNLANLNDSRREASPPKVTIHYDEMIAGVTVKFPVKPYLCQKAVMNNLIRGCTKEENCLIESPTGSGKTLALLCGALAWQEQYCEKINADLNQSTDVEDFCYEDDACCNLPFDSDKQSCDKSKIIQRVPKIFYGTRTHKQITQVVREFKKTVYRNKRMTILSSRDHTCIQESNRNKNELCNELLDPKKRTKCPYYNEQNKRNMASFEIVQRIGLEMPWDIEDLVSLGKRIGSCPYFAARSLMADAEIVMCPYNYIIDPNIRESMQINLKGDIIILDEAHNIEDTCREAASVDIEDIKLINASEECENLSHNRKVNKNMYMIICTYLRNFIRFLANVDVNSNDNQMVSKQWLGLELLEELNMEQIGYSSFPMFLAASKAAIQDFTSMRETLPERAIPTITFDTKTILEKLCFAIEMIRSETYVNDYKAYVVETEEYRAASTKALDGVWISMKNKRQGTRVLKLVCMNPAVVFAPIASAARSVILASGTLTPVSSFESELGTRFPHKLHANHVISKEQVYVRCISKGPGGEALKATYENVNDWTFMKGLGNLVLQVCDAVPFGVLCFFSSYPTMHKIHNRWKNTGIWTQLEKLKKIFVEPKYAKDLDEVMREYHKAIDESSTSSEEKSGAILFAIFRGKVAEGTDFSDNEARCVLTVGIPFSNVKDKAICMKRDYNNSNASKGLLPGSEWFTVNAFRALNQALGRCIRHKDDWGAVLLVDVRLQRELNRKNFEYLPKWIKEMWLGDNKYDLQGELENFVARHIARERGKKYFEKKKAQESYET